LSAEYNKTVSVIYQWLPLRNAKMKIFARSAVRLTDTSHKQCIRPGQAEM
jgi:hypothetical protein